MRRLPTRGAAALGLLAATLGAPVMERGAAAASPSHHGFVSHPPARAHLPEAAPPVTALLEALARDPAQPDVLVALGDEFAQIGDLARALSAYQEALRIRETHAGAFYGFWRARLQWLARTAGSARADALSAEGGPAEPELRSSRSWRQPEPDRMSSGRLRARLRANPGQVGDRLQLGQALLGLGDVAAAREQYREAVAIDPAHAEARVHLAQALMLTRDWTGARRHLEEALRVSPAHAEARYLLGTVRYTLGDLPGAMEAYRRALDLDPDMVQASFQLGVLLKLAGNEYESLVHLQKAAHGGVPRAQYLVGAAYRSGPGTVDDLVRSIDWWMRAAEQGLSEAREGLSRLRLAAQGNPSAEALRRAFGTYRMRRWAAYPDLKPSRPGESLGMRLLQRGRVEEAVRELLREALALSEPAHRVLETLYEVGVHGALPPGDARILELFQQTAADEAPRSLLVLSRIYGHGIGVPVDRDRARRLSARARSLRGGAPAGRQLAAAGQLPDLHPVLLRGYE